MSDEGGSLMARSFFKQPEPENNADLVNKPINSKTLLKKHLKKISAINGEISISRMQDSKDHEESVMIRYDHCYPFYHPLIALFASDLDTL